MIFRELKQNYDVAILDKNEISVTNGKVVSISFPHLGNNLPAMGNPLNNMQMVVDITIEANGKTATYTIPENLSVTYANNLVIATDRALLTKEIESMRTTAETVLASADKQKEIVAKTSELLKELNPQYKEKAANEERFNKIENSLDRLSNMLEQMLEKK